MDNPAFVVAIVFGLIFLIIASGLWIAGAIGLVGVILLYFWVGRGMPMLAYLQFNAVNTFTLTMMPLFIFMGELIFYSKLGDRLYSGATRLVGFLPGGLLHTNIFACAIFSAVTGSSIACAATIGTVAFPELEKRGYNRKLLLGSLAAGGTLGILIPPSLGFLIYGVFVGESIGKLFMAGVFPGLVLSGLFMLWIGIATSIRPRLAPERMRFSAKGMVLSFLDIWPMVVRIFMVLGTIYLGVATPTEAAALGALMAVIFCAIYRRLTWDVVKRAALSAVKISSWAMLIFIGAQIVSAALAMMRLPAQLSVWVASLEIDRLIVLTAVIVMYLIMGMFLDSFSMLFLTLPVVYPLILSLGFDSVWFGVVAVVLMEMALITPPVATNLYVIHGISGRKYLNDIIVGVIPFFLCMALLLVLLTIFPSLATWLPDQMIQAQG